MMQRFVYYRILQTNLPQMIFLGITLLSVISSSTIAEIEDGLGSSPEQPVKDSDDRRGNLDSVLRNSTHIAKYQLHQTTKKEAECGSPIKRVESVRERRKINWLPDKQREALDIPSSVLSTSLKSLAKRNENHLAKSSFLESSTFISSHESVYNDGRLLPLPPTESDSDLPTKRVIRSPKSRRPKPLDLEQEEYYWTRKGEIQEKEKRKRKRDQRKKSLSSSSNFFSLGSPEGQNQNKRKGDSKNVALLHRNPLLSVLKDSNFRKKHEFRDLEDKMNSYESRSPKGKEQSQIVKLNQENFFTEKIVSNPQIREYRPRKKNKENKPSYDLRHGRRGQALKLSKFQESDSDTVALPPFLKELDIPLNSMNLAIPGEKVDFSRFLNLLDSLPKGKSIIDKSLEQTQEGIVQYRNRDQHEFRSSPFRNPQQKFFDSLYNGKVRNDEKFDKSLERTYPSRNNERGNPYSSNERHYAHQHFNSISKGKIGTDDQFDQNLRIFRPTRKRKNEEHRSSRRRNRKRQRSDLPSKWEVGSDEWLYTSRQNNYPFRNDARKNIKPHPPRYESGRDHLFNSILSSKRDSEESYEKSSKGILPSFYHDTEYQSPEYRPGRRQSFGRKDPFNYSSDWQDLKINPHDSYEFSGESYGSKFTYDSKYEPNPRFGDSKNYDSSGSRRGRGRTKELNRYKDDYSDEETSSLDSSAVLESYEEKYERKKGRDRGRKNYNRYNDFLKDDLRGQSSFEEVPFRNYGSFFDKTPPNSGGDKSHFYNHDLNEFRFKAGQKPDYSVLDGFFNSKPRGVKENEARPKLNYKNRQNEDKIIIDIINSIKDNNKVKAKINKTKLYPIQIGGGKRKNLTKHFHHHKRPTNPNNPLNNVEYVSSYSTVPPTHFNKGIKNKIIHNTTPLSTKPTKVPYTHSTLSSAINLSTKNGGDSSSIHKSVQSNPPLSAGGSPVIINSTFFITTAAPFHFPLTKDFVPRLRTPSFVPTSIHKRKPNSIGNRIIFVNASKKKLGEFQETEKPLSPFPVNYRGLSGLSNPVDQKSNLKKIHPIPTIFQKPRIGTQPFSSLGPTQISHPTPYPNISSSHIPDTVTHFSNKVSFPSSATSQFTTPRPLSPFPDFFHPTTPFPGIFHTTSHSIISRQAAPFSITPNPRPHVFTTIKPIGFSASPYHTNPVPGTLKPNSPSSTTSYLANISEQPLPTLSVYTHPTTLPSRNIASFSIPNNSHSKKIPGPSTLPLVARESPVHSIKQNQNEAQTPGNHLNNRQQQRAEVRQKSTTTIPESNFQDTSRLQTPSLITLPPSSPKVVRRLRKKKRRFKVRRKTDAALIQGKNLTPTRIPLSRATIRSRRPKTQIDTSRNSKSRTVKDQNTDPSLGKIFKDSKIPPPLAKNEGIFTIEHSKDGGDGSLVKKVNQISRIQKPTKASKLFSKTRLSQPPFLTTVSDKFGEFPLVTTSLPRTGAIKSQGHPSIRLRNRLPIAKYGAKRLLSEKSGLAKNIYSHFNKTGVYPFDLRDFPFNNVENLPKNFHISHPDSLLALHPFSTAVHGKLPLFESPKGILSLSRSNDAQTSKPVLNIPSLTLSRLNGQIPAPSHPFLRPLKSHDSISSEQGSRQYLQTQDQRKVLQDVPIEKLPYKIIPHRTAYGSILLDPRSQNLPHPLANPLAPGGRPILHPQIGESLNEQIGRPISSTFHHFQPLNSPYLQRPTSSLYYGKGSYPVSKHGVPFNGIAPFQGGSHTLRNYSVRKTFSD